MADLKTLRSLRAQKRQHLLEAGTHPYPEKTPLRKPIEFFLRTFDSRAERKVVVRIAGRIMGLRNHGGATFFDCVDASGKIQVFCTNDAMQKGGYERVAALDRGDFVAVSGKAMRTRRGEATILARTVTMLSKALRSLPTQWYGLRDVEERFRAREVDLLLNSEVIARFALRSKLVSALRSEMENNGFLEVETPILQAVPGGAHAEPFKTTLRALKLPLYLRVAPELYLKRLLVGGFERVFELGRSFRNEGMDQTHNPEFTELEFYWAYQDLAGLLSFTEKLLRNVVTAATGVCSVTFRGSNIDFTKPFQRIDYAAVLRERTGMDLFSAPSAVLRAAARAHNVRVDATTSARMLVDHLFKKAVVPMIVRPTFVLHHPLMLSPLAKHASHDARRAARMQVIAGGIELVNAYAELNDPIEQRKRFVSERKHARMGFRDTQRIDEDFLTALEYGMPPAAGFGLGVDRFAMLLTDAPSLREVILFPTMRPRRKIFPTAKRLDENLSVPNMSRALSRGEREGGIPPSRRGDPRSNMSGNETEGRPRRRH